MSGLSVNQKLIRSGHASWIPFGRYFDRDALLVPSPEYCIAIIREHDRLLANQRKRETLMRALQ